MNLGFEHDIVIGHITFKDATEAKTLCRKMVEERLIACANISPEIHSIYMWEGVLQEDTEARAFVKTTAAKSVRVTDFLQGNHSYSVPSVVFWRVDSGNAPYLEWVRGEVK
jgi:periplasmic divalent cation tolerance protein